LWRTNFTLEAKTPLPHNASMTEKHPKRPRDLNQWAKKMLDIATGESIDRELTPEQEGKNPAAVALGRIGGLKGGKARAENMTARQRSLAARKAAKARWDSQD
jgi:hypothetical protein